LTDLDSMSVDKLIWIVCSGVHQDLRKSSLAIECVFVLLISNEGLFSWFNPDRPFPIIDTSNDSYLQSFFEI